MNIYGWARGGSSGCVFDVVEAVIGHGKSGFEILKVSEEQFISQDETLFRRLDVFCRFLDFDNSFTPLTDHGRVMRSCGVVRARSPNLQTVLTYFEGAVFYFKENKYGFQFESLHRWACCGTL